MNLHRLIASALLLGSMCAQPHAARAAQSLDTCAGFIDTLPATISTQGVWCLRHDLATNLTTGNAITIAANNVTIDCNDFKIGGLAAGDASQAKGISADNRQNATVRHCNIRGFVRGIVFDGGAGHLVEDNRLDNNLNAGIWVVGGHSLVQRNRVYDTGGSSLESYNFESCGICAYGEVIDNTVAGVFATGTDTSPVGIFLYGNNGLARGNRVSGLVATGSGLAKGLYAAYGTGSRIEDNMVSQASSTSGYGIRGSTKTACSANVVTNYQTAYQNCGISADTGGNMSF